MAELSNEEVSKLKNIEFYSQSVAATFNTSLEEEKTYIILSAASIGFLFNASNNQIFFKIIIFLAILFFLATLILSTKIFIINREYLIQTHLSNGKDQNAPENIKLNLLNNKLEIYSKINRVLFIFSISLLLISVFINFFIVEPTPEKIEKPNPMTINYFNVNCENL